MSSRIIIFIALILLLGSVSFSGTLAKEREALVIGVNQGALQKLNSPVLDILITNPDIADIQLTQGNGFFIYGKKPGLTHIMALAKGDKILFDRLVQVTRDLDSLVTIIGRQFPDNIIKLEESPGRLIVAGDVSSSQVMEKILSLTHGYLQEGEKVVNQLTLLSPQQVNLRVRIMEVNRIATEELGINWDILLNPGSFAVGLLSGRSPLQAAGTLLPNAGFGGSGSSALIRNNGANGSVSAVIDALERDNLITILAEPNLTSRSGKTASFFAGGEFPIPVGADDSRITVEFKKFGVILDMTPTVISPGRINLHIRPEVSELSTAGAVIVNNISVPGIAIRRAEATIELASGQSFSVAGLLQNNSRNLIDKVPWLGDIDILGPLFRSSKYQRSETELVIIATANIVQPVGSHSLQSPLTGFDVQTDPMNMQQGSIIKQRPAAEGNQIEGPGGLRLIGPRGYIY